MDTVEKRRGPWSDEEDLTLMKFMRLYTLQGLTQTIASEKIAEYHLPERTASAVATRFSGDLKHEYLRALKLQELLDPHSQPVVTAQDTSYDAIIHVLQKKATEEENLKRSYKTLQEHYDILKKQHDSLQIDYDDLERRHMELNADHNVFVRALQKAQEPVETVTLPTKNEVDNEEWVD